MKFAIIDGLRCEAEPGKRGFCEGCHAPVVAKCGDIRVWHWAHVGSRDCDPWREPETLWHRSWKNRFPRDQQEVRQTSGTGELHIADVKTAAGIVIEFQHSNISPAERTAREQYYVRMVWVVDGMRLKKDLPTFIAALDRNLPSEALPAQWKLPVEDVPVLRRWSGCKCPVYIDFGDVEHGDLRPSGEPLIWRLDFESGGLVVTVTPIRLQSFVAHQSGDGRMKGYRHPKAQVTARLIERRRVQARAFTAAGGFEAYFNKRLAKRRQRRF